MRCLTAAVIATLLACASAASAQQPLPFPTPLPSASPAQRGAFDRHDLTLAPGASAVVHLFGASAVTLVTSGAGGVDARYDAPSRSVTIVAQTFGDVTVT